MSNSIEHLENLINDIPLSWIPAPPHTCAWEVGVTAVIRPESTDIAPWKNDDWRKCEGCYHRRVDRFTKQVLAEHKAEPGQPFYILEVDRAEAFRLRDRWQKRDKARWKGFPIEDGQFAIIHNQDKEGGHRFESHEYPAIYEIIFDYCNAPELPPDKNGKRRSMRTIGTANFGHNYARSRGDTKAKLERDAEPEPIPQVIVRAREITVEAVAEYHKVDVPENREFTIRKNWRLVYQSLTNLCPTDLLTIDGQLLLPEAFGALMEYEKQAETVKNSVLSHKEELKREDEDSSPMSKYGKMEQLPLEAKEAIPAVAPTKNPVLLPTLPSLVPVWLGAVVGKEARYA